MLYRILLILIIIVCSNEPAAAQTDRYRVELLVLTHLNHGEDPAEAQGIADFTAATDFLTPVEDEAEGAQAVPPDCIPEEPIPAEGFPEDTPPGAGDGLDAQAGGLAEGAEAAEGAEEPVEEPDPNALIHLTEMSESMREAWRRLRLSAPFRPEQYLSWEQGSQAPFPVLRLHDLNVVLTEDPWFDDRRRLQIEELIRQMEEERMREEAGEPEPPPPTADELASAATPCPPVPAGGEEPVAEMEEEPAEPALPDPIVHYRLDGSVTLRRSRFLHLDLAVELREAVFEAPDSVMPRPDRGLLAAGPPADDAADEVPDTGLLVDPERQIDPDLLIQPPPEPDGFLLHGLQQSRQVKSGRMEYFDGPVLGVLALITPVEPEGSDTP